MATAQQVCTYALGLILNDDASATPATTDLNLALETLQYLLDHWQLDPQSSIGLKQYVYTPTAGDQVLTIGASMATVSVTSVSTAATVTTSAVHGLVVGDYVNIAGASPAAYNGKYAIVTVPSSTSFTYTFAGGTSPATGTILVNPDIIAPMPTRLEEASFCRLGGVDFLIGFAASFEEYNAQAVKTNQGYPTKCWFNRNETSLWGTLYLWPASNAAELHFWILETPLAGFSSMTLATTLTLPMGLQKALIDNLAMELMDSYNVPQPAYSQIQKKAYLSLKKWKRSNIKINMLQMPVSIGRYTANNYTA